MTLCYWPNLKTEDQLFWKLPFAGGSLMVSEVLSTSGNAKLLVKEDGQTT